MNLTSPLPQEQVQQRLTGILEHRTTYWWWEPKPKPYVGTVAATNFEVTMNSLYPQTRWMPIFVSGHVTKQKEGCSVALNFQTRKYQLAGFLWAAFVLYNLSCALSNILSSHTASWAVLGFLVVLVAILAAPYFLFIWAFNVAADNEKTFFCELLEAKEIRGHGPGPVHAG